MRGRGEAAPGGDYGDLYIRLHVKSDARFERDGADILYQLNIKVTDALLGATYTVPTVNGSESVTVPAGVTDGEEIILKNHGFPLGSGRSGRGTQRCIVHIEVPKKLSKAAKQLVEQLKAEGV
jgi:molecular chaperone DnaJ